MAKFFKKDLLSNLIHNRRGKRIEWEPLAENTGVLMLDEEKDAELIQDLNTLVAKVRGGVSIISEGEYSDIKGRLPYTPSESRSEMLKAAPSASQPPRADVPVAAGNPAPVQPVAPVAPVAPSEPAPPVKPFSPRLGRARVVKTPTP